MRQTTTTTTITTTTTTSPRPLLLLLRPRLPLLLLLVTAVTTACAASHAGDGAAATGSDAASRDATDFVAAANAELKRLMIEGDRVAWINETYITPDTDLLATETTASRLAIVRRLIEDGGRYDTTHQSRDVARQLELLRTATTMPAPDNAAERRELAEISTFLSSSYGRGKACLQEGEPCVSLVDLTNMMAEERDYDKLQAIWTGWRKIAVPMRDRYARFVELTNRGAREIGFRNAGELWRSGYDMSPGEFEAEVERLWQQMAPLYESLHCYVRKKLRAVYGAARIPEHGAIPAHLLGNMWAQSWGNIYELVEPYPGVADTDVTAKLKAAGWDATKMMRTGESFFTSLGFPPLPDTFWERSMLAQPRDREVICHASAWDMGGTRDVRIKMCTQPTEEDLITVHHELGHIYYDLSYVDRLALHQRGAHDGFHEGIGDTLVLSVTPAYLHRLGLLDAVSDSHEAEINRLMQRALEQVAFLPFAKLVDQWRWQVFDGRTAATNYNRDWWRLRQHYQGIVPPVARNEADFDPGAKYHIPANVPYTRYFLAQVLQFQFHRALCRVAGHAGPMHTCSIYGNEVAGRKLADMLELGASRPWPEALATLSGETRMDAEALVQYFAPLRQFLETATAGEQCGWNAAADGGSATPAPMAATPAPMATTTNRRATP